MNEENKWNATTVKAKLEELLSDLQAGSKPKISEQEIRELQHWFNETSAPFLRAAWKEMRHMEAKKRSRMCPYRI